MNHETENVRHHGRRDPAARLPHDSIVLVTLVRPVCRHEDAARLVMAEGAIVEGKDGQRVRHPAVIVEREAAETVRRLAREFGLTPSGRADLGHALPSPPPGLGPERLLT